MAEDHRFKPFLSKTFIPTIRHSLHDSQQRNVVLNCLTLPIKKKTGGLYYGCEVVSIFTSKSQRQLFCYQPGEILHLLLKKCELLRCSSKVLIMQSGFDCVATHLNFYVNFVDILVLAW